ncbi:alcohol dehydrogenase [Salegentibacter salinarum]|uniref:alcohol dehydrogenase n=1 Tax=Salegentibacter salinarum TaxID=447422 RepID=A0A2N0TNG0_9FLAO|nr:alcohol dehydrogenase AdhP [Salegentibacter salinarum]PKD16265.1 alcohol dehydrogenase [Salegentibacter salinarum]SKB67537.1 alcohol dehydrogenase, propanol-preferring [Salegentibacter salinarum]
MIPEKMKAAVVNQFGKPLSIENVPVKKPGRGEVLVKVFASGICHTDLHAAEGDWPVKPSLPFIPGHEGIGEVLALGEDVDFLEKGDIVGMPWLHTACGHCEYCITGWETLCDHQQNTGYSVNGTFAEYVLADAAFVGKFPKDVNYFEMAPILCAGVTVYKGIKETDLKPGEWIAISGVGGLGHLAVQYAKAMGYHVVAVDISQEKLDLATKHGADFVVNGKDPKATEEIKKRTKGGVHGVLVTAVAPVAFEQAIDMLRKRGTIAMVGLPPGSINLPIFQMVLNRFTIRGSIVGTRKDLQEAIDFAVEGKVHTTAHKVKLEDVNKVFEDMKQNKIEGRMVIDMQA